VLLYVFVYTLSIFVAFCEVQVFCLSTVAVFQFLCIC